MNPKTTAPIETSTELIWLEDDIMFCVVKESQQHTLEDAKENVQAAVDLSAGVKYPHLIDIRKCKYVSLAARNYYISYENSPVKACALIIDSPLSKVVGNLFIGMNKPNYPTRLFTSHEKALKWLMQGDEELAGLSLID